LHMAQLMPLPLTVTCFSKIQTRFTFLVPAHLGSPGKRAVKRVCVCCTILTYNDRDVTHLHMMMILSGAWPQATAWQGPSAACGRKASDGASRPAGPGYGLREIQGRESSGGAASDIY